MSSTDHFPHTSEEKKKTDGGCFTFSFLLRHDPRVRCVHVLYTCAQEAYGSYVIKWTSSQTIWRIIILWGEGKKEGNFFEVSDSSSGALLLLPTFIMRTSFSVFHFFHPPPLLFKQWQDSWIKNNNQTEERGTVTKREKKYNDRFLWNRHPVHHPPASNGWTNRFTPIRQSSPNIPRVNQIYSKDV